MRCWTSSSLAAAAAGGGGGGAVCSGLAAYWRLSAVSGSV